MPTGCSLYLHLGMKGPMLAALLLFSVSILFAQQNVLLIKKKSKTIQSYWPGAVIAFQLETGVWVKGEITHILADSFFVRPMMVHYDWAGTDTIRYNAIGFSVS